VIRLQFVAGKGISSDLIEWYGAGCVSHVDAVLDDGSLLGARSDVIGGKPAGVQIRPPGYEAFSLVIPVVLPVELPAMTAEFYRLLRAEIGKPYDETAILAFFTGRDWRAPDSWFCSELQATMLEQCGWFPTPLSTPANKLTPAGLLLALSARVPIVLPPTHAAE